MEIYFAGGSSEKCEQYLKDNNCKRLFSQFSDRKAVAKWIERGGEHIFLDSGAFSAYNSGKIINIDDLISYANTVIDKCDWVASLDVIGDGQKSYENFEYIRSKIADPDKLVPTFHINVPIEYLDKYLDYEDKFGKVKCIAMGGIAKKRPQQRKLFLDKILPYIRKKRPDIKIHAFGVTSADQLKDYDFDTADSTTWLKHSIYGHILLPNTAKTYHIGNSNTDIGQISQECLNEAFQNNLKELNITLEDLKNNDEDRRLFNIKSTMQFINNRNLLSKQNKILKKSLI